MQVWYVDNGISEKYVCPTGRPILKIMVWIYGFSVSNVIVLDSTVPLDHFLYPPLIMNQCGVESCPIQMFFLTLHMLHSEIVSPLNFNAI